MLFSNFNIQNLGKHLIILGTYVILRFKIQVDLYLGLQLSRDFNKGIQCYFCMNIGFHMQILLTSSECYFFAQVMGRTGGNKVTFFKGDSSLIGSFVDVKISEATAASLRGECEICQHSFGVTLTWQYCSCLCSYTAFLAFDLIQKCDDNTRSLM